MGVDCSRIRISNLCRSILRLVHSHQPLLYLMSIYSFSQLYSNIVQLTDALEAHAPHFTDVDSVASIQRRLVEVTAPCVDGDALSMHDELRSIGTRLRSLNSRATDAIETVYAHRMLMEGMTPDSFPHFSNYTHLTAHVVEAVKAYPHERLLFIGSGPFPITALLALQLFRHVECVDYDERANMLAAEIVSRLGLESQISFTTRDARDLGPLSHDAILVASLVGDTEDEKREIYGSLRRHMRPGSLLMGRDSHGLRSLVYQRIPEDVWEGMIPVSTRIAGKECMNSLVAAQLPQVTARS